MEVIFDHDLTAIVFMMEKGALKQVDSLKDDWRVALMAKVTQKTQHEEIPMFIPINAQLDFDEEDWAPDVDGSLADVMELEQDQVDLPQIYLLHGISHQTIAYPWKLDDIQKVSPELILAWAKVQKFKLDIEVI